MTKIITSQIVVAYAQCPRKAFLLFTEHREGDPHEYATILEHKKHQNYRRYLQTLRQKGELLHPYTTEALKQHHDNLFDAQLQVDAYEATCGLLTRTRKNSSRKQYYEPAIFVGTHKIDKYQKLELFFTVYVLQKIQKRLPSVGLIVTADGKPHKVKLDHVDRVLLPYLEPIQQWVNESLPEEPPVILNKHCPLCQFRQQCREKAEQEDNLSLLDHVTPKVIRRYEKKGIFTVRQLSYLFKPRKRKKRAKNPTLTHNLELQALAIREQKIYLQELPEIERKPVELFLDIEGIPDQGLYYLIGLLECTGEETTYYPFWADSAANESQIWQQFVSKVEQHPSAPIYHYGRYELRAISVLASRYNTVGVTFEDRLINVNKLIYGRVYFPVHSNRLKEIGNLLGARWTSSDASGLRSLIWRHHWDETEDTRYRERLLTYNEEDCLALEQCVKELHRLSYSASTLVRVDFADQPKHLLTKVSKEVYTQFSSMLAFAHANYDAKKIHFRQETKSVTSKRPGRGSKAGYQGQRKHRPKAMKVVELPPGNSCPVCNGEPCLPTKYRSTRLIIDLMLTKNGVRKTITEYVGIQGYCLKCQRNYAPVEIRKYGANTLYGHGLKAWVIYQRVAMRLPYESIAEAMREQFNEETPSRSIGAMIKDLSYFYAETEEQIIKNLLGNPFIHVDETPVSIRGATQYVWVFTDGKNVIFKLRNSREASFLQEFLINYTGIIISDFYSGYDSLNCGQQKCWVHLIRNLNDDLWKAPFDVELEVFVQEVRDLIIPIMETIQKYGLKKRNLGKFRREVERFYKRVIFDRRYRSELVIKYQTRFLRYKGSLFTFLEDNGIPWNNNAAERAIRHIAKQRVISGNFHEEVTHHYLRLLGIRQTCRFRGKSFFQFLFSGEKDIDEFKRYKR